MTQTSHQLDYKNQPDESILFKKTPCLAKYLCSKPSGIETCSLFEKDWRGCPNLKEEDIMYVSPDKIICKEACRCEYAGKREGHCDDENGSASCGVTLNGKIPEGEVPRSLVEKVRQVVPMCRMSN